MFVWSSVDKIFVKSVIYLFVLLFFVCFFPFPSLIFVFYFFPYPFPFRSLVCIFFLFLFRPLSFYLFTVTLLSFLPFLFLSFFLAFYFSVLFLLCFPYLHHSIHGRSWLQFCPIFLPLLSSFLSSFPCGWLVTVQSRLSRSVRRGKHARREANDWVDQMHTPLIHLLWSFICQQHMLVPVKFRGRQSS